MPCATPHPAGHALQDHDTGHPVAGPLGATGVDADDTGVIFASAFPGWTISRMTWSATTSTAATGALTALEAVRVRLTGDEPAAAEVDRRIHELRHEIESHPYEFDRRSYSVPVDGPFAVCRDHRRARAEHADQCRVREHHSGGRARRRLDPTGRCRRVIVVSADDASSDALLPWLASGFLASGAAAKTTS